MKKSILGVVATAVVWGAVGTANAQTTTDSRRITIDTQAILAEFCRRHPSARVCTRRVSAVPEIDATSGTQALALVLGVGLLGAEGLRRRRALVRTR
ncbi:MAG: VPEID-CTERM sorting domain-containing protein [Gammaproteobacteria bacterium]|nr:VPEID-CTERM sorting domain-containing protein [Gammaproteobacteria bacterium]